VFGRLAGSAAAADRQSGKGFRPAPIS